MQHKALAILEDEHRSIAAVLHGLKYLVNDIRVHGATPNYKLLWAMLYYLEAFPAKLHHPKESSYLFRCLKARTRDADPTLEELEQQHERDLPMIHVLQHTLGLFEAGQPDGIDAFSTALERYADMTWNHMGTEERVILPLAKKHLTPEDWHEIAAAFGDNGDPRFGAKPDHEFRDLFSRIVNLAPPPIGLGPAPE